MLSKFQQEPLKRNQSLPLSMSQMGHKSTLSQPSHLPRLLSHLPTTPFSSLPCQHHKWSLPDLLPVPSSAAAAPLPFPPSLLTVLPRAAGRPSRSPQAPHLFPLPSPSHLSRTFLTSRQSSLAIITSCLGDKPPQCQGCPQGVWGCSREQGRQPCPCPFLGQDKPWTNTEDIVHVCWDTPQASHN